MNVPGDANGEPEAMHDPSARMRARMAMMRERWSRLPTRRKRALIAVAGVLLLVALLRRRGAPLIQLNLEVTFRPVASTAVSLFGPATVGDASGADED